MFKKNSQGKIEYTPESFGLLRAVPAYAAIARTVDPTISTSTEITLNKATSFLSVYAIAKDVYLKYGTSDVTASNFDEVIIAGKKENFLVPDGVTAINVIEREAGATVIVVEK